MFVSQVSINERKLEAVSFLLPLPAVVVFPTPGAP